MSTASDLDAAIAKSISTIPECLAAGYIDVGSGFLLGIKTVDSHPREVIDLVAAATSDLFQGANVGTVEAIWKRARGVESNRHYFQEYIINSDNAIHVFIRGKKYQDYVAVFVCRNTANIGMVLAKSRMAMPMIESAV
ncbi:hypothetical protein [Acidocella sp.]|jgi:hypothetical protein|uniref:hypothetical protein n=1 Tax=Acidocella sp. TaxID=50710 RepID=UPI00260CAAE8|nr:hypothetical protein [Acidocella sp.]